MALRSQFNDSHSPISLADVMLKVLLMVFLAMIVLSVIAKKKAEDGNIRKKAEYMATIEWNKERDDAIDCDIDMWVRNPEGQIVFWRSRENALMNVERDDLGKRNDFLKLPTGETILNPEDKEYWYLRGIVAGEYTINVHAYTCMIDGNYVSFEKRPLNKPLKVLVQLIRLNPKMELAAMKEVTIESMWQEKTAMNFTLDAAGNVSNITDIPVPLVSSDRGGEASP
jgi:hypothetical protein